MENEEPKVYKNHGQDSRIKEVKTAPQLNAKANAEHAAVVGEGVDLYNQALTGDQHCPLRTAGGHGAPAVMATATIRRLTPTECERLQGFPDGYTAIPWKKKPASECPDGPRYKALGNSWAVPCAAWIGRRIQAVEDSMKIIQEDLW